MLLESMLLFLVLPEFMCVMFLSFCVSCVAVIFVGTLSFEIPVDIFNKSTVIF